jgi:hypothetical protein
MWTYNIVRGLIAAKGHRVLPERVPKLEAEVLAAAQRAMADADPDTRWVLKTHHAVPFGARDALVILPLRDPRDVILSLMRFMRVGLPHALRGVDAWSRLIDQYRQQLPPDRVLWLRYADIVERSCKVVDDIAAFLRVKRTPEEIGRLVAGLSKEAVRERLDRLMGEGDAAERVTNPDGSIRLFDPLSGFQTGHVTDYRDGDWRRLLPPQEAATIAERYADWLLRHGLEAKAGA